MEQTQVTLKDRLEEALKTFRSSIRKDLPNRAFFEEPYVAHLLRRQRVLAKQNTRQDYEYVLQVLIQEIRPPGREPESEKEEFSEDWGQYYSVKWFFIDGVPLDDVCHILHVEKDKYYQLRANGLDAICARINQLTSINFVNTLDEPLWKKYSDRYIRRKTPDGRDLVKEIVADFAERGFDFVVLTGPTGSGKTTVAYWVGQESWKSQFVVVAALSVTAKTTIDELLNSIGNALGKRNVEAVDTIPDKCHAILEELSTRDTLLIFDDVELLQSSSDHGHWDILVNELLNKLPSETKCLATASRRAPLEDPLVKPQLSAALRKKEYIIEGMQEAEAFEYMRNLLKARGGQEETDEDLRIIHAAVNGIPGKMREILSLGPTYGLSVRNIVRMLAQGQIPNADRQDTLLPASDDRALEYKISTIAKHHPKAISVLFGLTAFVEPVNIAAIQAGLDMDEITAIASLGVLFNHFLSEKIDDYTYDLLPSIRQYLNGAYVTGVDGKVIVRMLTEVTELQVPILHDVRQRLVTYYVRALRGMHGGQRVQFFGRQKETIMTLLDWCLKTQRWEQLIDLFDVVGNPLGTIGRLKARLAWGEIAMDACEKWHGPKWQEYQLWFAVHDVAWAKARLRDVDGAQSIWLDCLEKADIMQFTNVKALALRNLSQVTLYTERGNNDVELRHAVDQLETSIDLWQDINDEEWLALTRIVLGMVLERLKMPELAENVLEQAYDGLVKQNHTDGIIEAIAQLALVKGQLGEVEDALHLSDQAIEKARTELTPPAPAYANALFRRAQLMASLGRSQEIVQDLTREAFELYRKCASTTSELEAMIWLGQPRSPLPNVGE